MSEQINLKMSSKLYVDEETKENFLTFFETLKKLPKELDLEIILGDSEPTGQSTLKFNIGDLVIKQVTDYFNK